MSGSGTGTRYGTFTLSHAYMDFTWANTKLTVGQQWQSWGFQPSYTFLGLYDLLMSGRGNTVPQISITQNFNKNFYGTFGIQEPYNMKDQYGGSASLAIAQASINIPAGTIPANIPGLLHREHCELTTVMPDFTAELGYKSEAAAGSGRMSCSSPSAASGVRTRWST